MIYYNYMRFMREPPEAAERAIAHALTASLTEGKRVVWLVCGGSNIVAEARIMATVRERAADVLARLTILPTDERYGRPGHPDSNYRQLSEAGFDPGPARWTDVLGGNLPLGPTVDYYTELVADAWAVADVVIAQFGIGPDGHIAGILPSSPATRDDAATIVGYDAPDFTRLTLTARQLVCVDHAFALAYGDSKRDALGRLRVHTEPFATLPSSLLYDIADASVYTDNNSENKE